MVTAFNFVGGAPTRPWRDDGDVFGRHTEGGGSTPPCRVVLAAIPTGSQQCQVLTAVNIAGSSRAVFEVVLMAQIIGREAAARLEGHLSALPDARLTAVNSLALVRKSDDRIWRRPWISCIPRLDTISSLAALCSSGPT